MDGGERSAESAHPICSSRKEDSMQHARPNRLRRAVAFAVLAAVLGLVSLTLSQCTMLGDNLTGVNLQRGGPTSCIQQCLDTFHAARQLCLKNHATAKEQCKQLPEPEQSDCLAEAEAEKDACIDEAEAEKDRCQADCHRQGAGSAG
jgi:hypothetical protein